MKRSLLVVATLAFALPVRAEDPPPWLPLEPVPSPAPYVEPLSLLGDLPEGRVRAVEEGVLLDRDAASRVSALQKIAPKLSDERAALSWRLGWSAGVEAMIPRLNEERAGRIKAESLAKSAKESSNLFPLIASSAGALAIGVILGAYLVRL